MFNGIDRFLATILAAIALIVVVAIVLVWRSPASVELEYREGANPADVVHNFIVAVNKGNEERAKSYLSQEVLENIAEREDEYEFSLINPRTRVTNSGMRVTVEESGIEDGLATVDVEITHFFSSPSPTGLFGLFNSNQYSTNYALRLRQFDGAWLIIEPFDPYMVR